MVENAARVYRALVLFRAPVASHHVTEGLFAQIGYGYRRGVKPHLIEVRHRSEKVATERSAGRTPLAVSDTLPRFLLPTNDLVFKVLLEKSPRLLNAMLSAVLAREMEVEEILNPGLGDGVKDKLMLLDLRVRFADGSRAFVEMQTTNYPFLRERFIGYLGREYSSQAKKGSPYAVMARPSASCGKRGRRILASVFTSAFGCVVTPLVKS